MPTVTAHSRPLTPSTAHTTPSSGNRGNRCAVLRSDQDAQRVSQDPVTAGTRVHAIQRERPAERPPYRNRIPSVSLGEIRELTDLGGIGRERSEFDVGIEVSPAACCRLRRYVRVVRDHCTDQL